MINSLSFFSGASARESGALYDHEMCTYIHASRFCWRNKNQNKKKIHKQTKQMLALAASAEVCNL